MFKTSSPVSDLASGGGYLQHLSEQIAVPVAHEHDCLKFGALRGIDPKPPWN